MGGIWELNKLILFLIFFIPGFISSKVYSLLVASKERSNYLLDAIGYSSLNFAAFSWLIILMHSTKFFIYHKILYFIFLFLIMFIAPILWPIIYFKISTSTFLSKYILHPIQSPWDYVFRRGNSYWVIIHLKDGRKIGGKFSTNSFASSYPSKEQIYLEEVWKLDENGRFKEPVESSQGIIILGDEILAVELFK
ncbi:hypothetical protein SAMN06269117_10457 [Balnearium lithotrophicum]|uniref:Uncharacterized protein n=1 Tax=Balnearium lithotrophicum TaxID=223788 RepID=A0A521B7D3_9BACT|nr:DUF6338 family protein [Balnearium lithotrophicum]SMO43022.1 hypothetical protein SAMN06269117_10457 [Balnearium lithotrophicum]